MFWRYTSPRESWDYLASVVVMIVLGEQDSGCSHYENASCRAVSLPQVITMASNRAASSVTEPCPFRQLELTVALGRVIMWRSQEITFWINSLSPWLLPFYKRWSCLDFSLLRQQIHKNSSILSPLVLQPESDNLEKYHLLASVALGRGPEMKELLSHLPDTPVLTPTHLLYFVFLQPSTFTVVHGGNAMFILGVWVFFTSFRGEKAALGFWVTLWLGLAECFLFYFALGDWYFLKFVFLPLKQMHIFIYDYLCH